MNRQQATRLVEEYFSGRKNLGLKRFPSTLSDDAVTVEDDGAAYRGVR